MRITRRIEFSASHSCYSAAMTEAENKALFGPDANPHGHGHNYTLEVTVEGEPDPVTGMIVDLKDVKEVLHQEVVEPMDHRHLNHEVEPFRSSVIPTTENLAIEIWRRVEPKLSGPTCRLQMVRVYETEDLYVDYCGK